VPAEVITRATKLCR